RSCLIGMRLADLAGLPAPGRSDLFYALLLKDAGCSSTSKHRERGAHVARRLGLSEATATAILTMDERWDGRGAPHGLRAADIPILGRVIGLAQAVEVFAHQHSPEQALHAVEQHSGTWFDPDLVRALQSLVRDTMFWERLTTEDAQTLVATLGPRESAIPA